MPICVPNLSKAHVTALIEGDGWIKQGANLLLFGPPGVGKSHLVCAIGKPRIRRTKAISLHRPPAPPQPPASTPEAFEARINAQLKSWGEVICKAGIRGE